MTSHGYEDTLVCIRLTNGDKWMGRLVAQEREISMRPEGWWTLELGDGQWIDLNPDHIVGVEWRHNFEEEEEGSR